MLNGEWSAGAKSAVLTVNGRAVGDEIVSLTYTDDLNGDPGALKIGSTAAARLRLVIDRPSVAYKDAQLEVSVGGVPLGVFTAAETSEKDGRLTVDAYDAMAGDALALGFVPAAESGTALGVVRAICAAAGLELGDVSGITDVPVDGLKGGYTRREALGQMAALLGRNAHIDRAGRLVLRWYERTGVSVTPDDYYAGDLTRRDGDFTLERIECSVTTTETTRQTDDDGTVTVAEQTRTDTLTAGDGVTGISIACSYMTQALLDGIFARLGGFSYRPLTVTFYGDCRIESGDRITVAERNGQTYDVPVSQVVHAWDGGVRTTVTAVAPVEAVQMGGALAEAVNRLTAELGLFKNVEAENIAAVNARFQRVKASEAAFGTLLAEKADIADLNAVEARFGRLDADYARVDLANVDTASVGTGFAQRLLVDQGLVADAVTASEAAITGYLSGVGIVANSIRAGTLDAGSIEVVNLNAANITVGTINGRQIAPGAITEENLAQSVADDIRDARAAAERGIVAVAVEYARGTSPTAAPADGWSPSAPAWEEGYYLWQRTATTLASGDVDYSDTLCITGVKGADGEAATVVRIDSSRGTLFKNSNFESVLTVHVMKGALHITDLAALRAEYGAGACLEWKWRRFDDADFRTILSTDPHISQDGFAFTVTPDDVDEKIVFQCDLVV